MLSSLQRTALQALCHPSKTLWHATLRAQRSEQFSAGSGGSVALCADRLYSRRLRYKHAWLSECAAVVLNNLRCRDVGVLMMIAKSPRHRGRSCGVEGFARQTFLSLANAEWLASWDNAFPATLYRHMGDVCRRSDSTRASERRRAFVPCFFTRVTVHECGANVSAGGERVCGLGDGYSSSVR